ncbi:MAG: LysM peptidoglycan-binding domain-containing protein [Bacilli bacterium]|nr:LysM peptidoglycan-binding domain-containing protein [Bacilli bacterium]
MKKIVPFRKELEFNTEVAEITSISLEHTLQKQESNFVSGALILMGEYKIVDVSVNTEKFNFTLPFDINIDNHYETKDLIIDIDDFYYELKDSKMIVNISILLDNLEEKEEILEREPLKKEIVELKEENKVIEEERTEKKVPNESASEDEITEAYRTYKIYIVRENDTIEQIMERFKVTKEIMELYNDISNITVGVKLIIPTNNDEKI